MLRVLTYHRVADPSASPGLNPRLISATPARFARQVRHVADSYHAVTLEEVLSAVERGTPLPERSVLITFDDAYADFGRTAWPILKHFRLPVTLFVPTAYPGQPERSFWWDRLYRALFFTTKTELEHTPIGTISLRTPLARWEGVRRLGNCVKSIPHEHALPLVDDICARLGSGRKTGNGVLSWDALRRLSREGVTLGAHTRTHPLLTRVAPALARHEIVGSQQDLQSQIGRSVPVFCFPDGDHDDTTIDILKQEGFSLAFTTELGHNDMHVAEPLRLRRTNIGRRTSPLLLRFRLSRCGGHVDAWRDARRRTTGPATPRVGRLTDAADEAGERWARRR